MSELKVGDKVYTGPYEIVQFRDTYNPGPQDTGDTVILSRRGHGAMGADTCLVIPAPDNLAAVARVLAAHPGIGEALVTISGLAGDTITSAALRARVNGGRLEMLDEYQQAQDMVDALAAALNGGTE